MSVAVEPRALTVLERSVVDRILQVDFSGVAELRRQLDLVRVVARWAVDSVSVDLQVVGHPPRSPVQSGVAPVECLVKSDGGQFVGEILLWTEFGMLAALEYAWYGDEPPASLPKAGQLVTRSQQQLLRG
ncbi:hypothetical protein B1813_06520 [Saccharomonospora piscinae]|uniref:Uncharacterized protein n=1 Tax=Saccharomonospora piscinae TaxID=687388 RepID=A0A1V9A4R2_SACPI|nr:hypothetical protein [Saccharomonospora piscinae]OQO91934.1 hypothetical protein B1813_06520 [Saccharomonospora piscinae]